MCRKQDANWSNQRLTRRQVTFERIDVRDTMKRKPSKLKEKEIKMTGARTTKHQVLRCSLVSRWWKWNQTRATSTFLKIEIQLYYIELLTLPVGVRVLVIFGVVVVHTKWMQPEIGHFENETAVHHTVAWFKVSVRTDFRRVNVGHCLKGQQKKPIDQSMKWRRIIELELHQI